MIMISSKYGNNLTILLQINMTKVSFTKEEKSLLFDVILDNFPEDKQLQHKFATIYNKIGGVIK